MNDNTIEKLEDIFSKKLLMDGGLYDINSNLTPSHKSIIESRFMFERDKDYLVQDGKVLIVDEFTGELWKVDVS